MPDSGDSDSVDRNNRRAIAGIEYNRADGGFAIAGSICSFRFAAARRKTGFVDATGGIGRTGRIVRCNYDCGRQLVFLILGFEREQFILLEFRKRKCGRRQQITQFKGVADIANRIGKITARTLRRTGSRLWFVADQQGRQIERRNRHAVNDELRDEHRAVRDYHIASVRQADHKIAADYPNVIQFNACRQNDRVLRPCLQHRNGPCSLKTNR